MGHAAGEATNGVELLGLIQLRLQARVLFVGALAVADVSALGYERAHDSAFHEHRCEREIHESELAAGSRVGHLRAHEFAARGARDTCAQLALQLG